MKGFYLVLIAAVIVAGCTGNYGTSTEKDAVSDLNAAKASEVLFIGDGGTFALNAVPVLKKINGVNYSISLANNDELETYRQILSTFKSTN